MKTKEYSLRKLVLRPNKSDVALMKLVYNDIGELKNKICQLCIRMPVGNEIY